MRAAGSDLTFSQSTLASMRRGQLEIVGGHRRLGRRLGFTALRRHRPFPRPLPVAPDPIQSHQPTRLKSSDHGFGNRFYLTQTSGFGPVDSRQPKITGINVVELAAFPALESPCGDTGPLPLPDPIQDHPPHRLKTDSISRRPRASSPVASTPSAPRESISWAWACSLSWRSLNPTASLPGLAEEMSETKGYRPGDF